MATKKLKKAENSPEKLKQLRLIQRQPNRPRRAVSSGRKNKS